MKAQCDRCKEIVALDFTVDGTGIHVRCPACRAEYSVAATAPPVPAAPGEMPAAAAPPSWAQMTCPKCGEQQRQAEACRRCGLIIARWDPETVPGDPVLGDVRDAAAMWTALEAAWDDGEQHEAFIAHCRRAGVLAFAAARYRQTATRPGAADRLAQIRVLAEQSIIAAPRTPPPAKRSSMRTLLLAMVMLALVAIGWWLLQNGLGAGR